MNKQMKDIKLSDMLKKNPEHNLSLFYERAYEEFLNEQGKVDGVFALFVTVLSLATPYTFTVDAIGSLATTIFLFGISVIALLLTYISIRHQANYIICGISIDTLVVLMNINQEDINKTVVKRACYNVLKSRITASKKVREEAKKKRKIYIPLSSENATYISIMSFLDGVIISIFVYSYLKYIAVAIGNPDMLQLLIFALVFSVFIVILTVVAINNLYKFMCYTDLYRAVVEDNEEMLENIIRCTGYLNFIYNEEDDIEEGEN